MKTIKIACDVRDTLNLEELQPFQGELKSLSREDYEKLKREILETGFAFPIHVWRSPEGVHFIIGGHQRLRGLQEMKKEGFEIPPVPVVKVHAENFQQAKRRVLQDVSQYGKVESQGAYEFLHKIDMSVDEFISSFRVPDINADKFKAEYYEDPEPKGDEDAIPEIAESFVKPGEIWTLGDHRLMCGDSTNKDHIERLLAGEKPNLVFTDPPYAVNYGPSFSKRQGGDVGMQGNYKESDTPLYEFLNLYEAPILIMSFPVDRHFFSLGENLQRAGYANVRELIWCKPSPTFHPGQTYQQQHEPILICRKKDVKYPEQIPSDAKTIFHVDKPSAHDEHPTAKPMELWSRLLEWHSKKGDLIAEPFQGSGSTLIACEKLGRRCYGMELDPHYCGVVIERWQKYTGKEAHRST